MVRARGNMAARLERISCLRDAEVGLDEWCFLASLGNRPEDLPMLPRVLEPEIMDTAEDAADYDAMDHGAVNEAFCRDLLAARPAVACVLDAGTGTGLIAVELCRRAPAANIVAIDLANEMLALAKKNVQAAGYADRIEVARRDAKHTGFDDGDFSAVISNSLLHHLPEPGAFLTEAARLLAPGGLLFVRDLARPVDEAALSSLVDQYARVTATDATLRSRESRQRALFAASLRAALTRDEVSALLPDALRVGARVELTSDRHYTLVARKARA